jgi:hypothetical protein
METTKNKNSQASLSFYRFLNPYLRVWFSFGKSQTFGKSVKTVSSIFEIHRLVWISIDFWLF